MEIQASQADINRLASDLKGFEDRKEVLKSFRKSLREPLPDIRKALRKAAVDRLPRRNGLGEWVARTVYRANVSVTTGSAAGVAVRGGRNSDRKRSDIRAIDRGRVRAPSWGHRTAASWHTQAVKPGFFTETISGFSGQYGRLANEAVAEALEVLRRGPGR